MGPSPHLPAEVQLRDFLIISHDEISISHLEMARFYYFMHYTDLEISKLKEKEETIELIKANRDRLKKAFMRARSETNMADVAKEIAEANKKQLHLKPMATVNTTEGASVLREIYFLEMEHINRTLSGAQQANNCTIS